MIYKTIYRKLEQCSRS